MAAGEGITIEVTASDGDAATCRLSGELDASNAATLRTQLEAVVADGHTRLVLDVGELEFIDSTGLRAIVLVDETCREAGGALILHEPTEVVRRVLRIAGVDEHFGVGGG